MNELGVEDVVSLSKEQSEVPIECKTDELILRLSKIEGQIRGISKMIEKMVYCDDVLIQVIAVQSALYGVGKLILDDHIRNRLSAKTIEADDQIICEMLNSIQRLRQIGSK